jgi:hypothetical protein
MHREYVAREIDCPVERITALEPFQWIERDHLSRELRFGTVSVPKNAPTRRGPSATPRGDAKPVQR